MKLKHRCISCACTRELVMADGYCCACMHACRYMDKAGLVDIHQKSEPFIKFKQACRDANLEVTTDGESYIETDMGIM